MSSLNFWTPDMLEPFLPYGPCTSLSLPGHYPARFADGFSTPDLTAPWLAEHLAEAIRRLVGSQPVLLVGHSTGGYAVLDLAAHYPDLPCGVISISGFAQGRWGIELRLLQHLARRQQLGRSAFRFLLGLGGMGPVFRSTARFHTPLPPQAVTAEEYPAMIEENLRNFRGFSPEAMQTYFAAMWETNIFPLLPHITAPTLVLCGSADPAVPPAQSRRIAAAIPGSTLSIIPGALHHPFYDRPAQFHEAVRSWLEKTFDD